tara:strand:+ start:29152 stop:33744 length:4593 start_codon:yes stop_codon:yes gene_type:complete
MKININFKLYTLLLTIFLIFNLSCEDADYPTIFEDNSTYTLLLGATVSNGSNIDYNDEGASEYTIITATLYQISSDGSSSLKSNAQINFESTFNTPEDPSNPPSLMDSNGMSTTSGVTNSQGQVILTWADAGHVGDIQINAEYIDNDGYSWTPLESITFTIHSIYEKVTSLSPIPCNFEGVELTAGQPLDGTIGAIVKEGGSPVAGATVHLIDPMSIDNPNYIPTYNDYLYFTGAGETAISNTDGEAIFNVRLTGGSALTNALSSADNNTIVIEQIAYVENKNLNLDICDDGTNSCNDCCGIDCNGALDNCDGVDKSTTVTITISSPSISIDDTYNLIDLVSLTINPGQIVFNDIPSSDSDSETSDNDSGNNDDSNDENNDTEDNDSGSSTNENNSTTLEATVRDEDGSGVSGIPVRFTNSSQYGTFTMNDVLSGDDGVSQTVLQNISIPNSTEIYDIELAANIFSPSTADSILHSDTTTFQIGYQSAFNIAQVDTSGGLDVALIQSFTTVNNISVQYSDTVKVNVVNSDGAPVQNVPIQFSLEPNQDGELVGTISSNLEWSDSNGSAMVVYELTPGDLEVFADSIIYPVINIYISDHLQTSTNPNWTINIEGSPNIENDVAEFNYYSTQLPGSIHALTMTTGDTLTLPFIAKDEYGIRIEGVPVQYEIFGSSSPARSYGNLTDALTYTCCSDTSVVLIDLDNNGNATQAENIGIATTNYSNIITEAVTTDSIRAFITDPITNEVIFQDEVYVTVQPPSTQIAGLFSYAIPETILMNTPDSVYCDTITTLANDVQGQSLPDVNILFSLDANDQPLGYISDYSTITDTIPGTDFYGSRITFCTWPNLDLDGIDTVNINITAPQTSPLLTDLVEIYLVEDLPECPNCEASVTLSSEYYELPAGDNDIFTTLVTATVIDSTENPVPENTLVQFASLTENEDGDLIPIGSIEPYKFTDSLGVASAIFNMESDAGLAQIIASAPAFNLADTIYINLTSTQATAIELVPPFPNEIMVQGGGGTEATSLQVRIKDATENLVTEPFLVKYQVLTSAPQGVYLNEHDDNDFVECVQSTNGIATATLNSGTQPGSVPIKVELYPIDLAVECNNIDSGTYSEFGIAALESVPVTVVTGPPQFGQINYSYVDITPIGGGEYEVPLTVSLWDFYSNPVADSTNVYIWIEGIASPWDGENVTYTFGDTVKWGGLDDIGNVIEVDSLLYIWNVPTLDDDLLTNPTPGNGFEINGDPVWLPVAHPGSVVGEAKTGMEAPDGNSYPGIAWSTVHYGTSNMFDNTVIKALTYKANGEKLIVDGRDSHNGEGLVLPFQPGVLGLGADVQFWDYSVFGVPGLNNLTDTVAVNVQANLTDYYQYPVDNGTVVLSAPGANIWEVCDPVDTDNDGFIGCCDSFDVIDNIGLGGTGSGDGVCDVESEFSTCSVCVANGGTWIPDGAQDDPNVFGTQINGPNDVNDDPAYGKTNGDGLILWNISYSEALNPGDGDNPETYEDFTSTVTAQLIDPLQTASEGVDILLIKSELNENP